MATVMLTVITDSDVPQRLADAWAAYLSTFPEVSTVGVVAHPPLIQEEIVTTKWTDADGNEVTVEALPMIPPTPEVADEPAPE